MIDAFKELLGITSGLETFYWITALSSSFLFLIKTVLALIGADHEASDDVDFDFDGDVDADIDGDVDADADGDSDVDHSMFSINSILAFFMGLGWIGVIGYRSTSFAPWAIFSIALGNGIFAFLLMAFLLKKMKGLESSGTLDLNNTIGQVGTVYLSIPADGKGMGQIQIEVQERLTTLDAKSSESVSIRTGQKVLVYDVEGDVLCVSPYIVEGE